MVSLRPITLKLIFANVIGLAAGTKMTRQSDTVSVYDLIYSSKVEGLTLETSSFQNSLRRLIYLYQLPVDNEQVFHLPANATQQFLYELIPLFILKKYLYVRILKIIRIQT